MTQFGSGGAGVKAAVMALILGCVALVIGYFLADSPVMLGLSMALVISAVTLPYHADLSILVSTAASGSALILPFIPGRPMVWEFAALLGWSGLIVVFWMRQSDKSMWGLIRDSKWLFVGLTIYCAVLVVTMLYRGVGFRVSGSGVMGGRFYAQQLVCAIFPLLFCARPPSESLLTRLFGLQCLLSLTFIASDLAFSFGSGGMENLLYFLELPTDAMNFQLQTEGFRFRRFQSFSIAATGLLYLLMARLELKAFVGARGIYLLPLALAIFAFGLMGGHRYMVVVVTLTVLCAGYAQRLFKVGTNLMLAGLLLLLLTFLYAFADHLPLAAQRAVSLLPAIDVNSAARQDAEGTWMFRAMLRDIGLSMAPDYFWIGRGFGIAADTATMMEQSTLNQHLNMGRFYNGVVGLLVNTGIFGLLSMALIIGAGTRLAWKVIRHIRTYGADDIFSRTASVIAGVWMASVISFVFLHGDSEWALKNFSLQCGLLITCRHQLNQRLVSASVSAAQGSSSMHNS